MSEKTATVYLTREQAAEKSSGRITEVRTVTVKLKREELAVIALALKDYAVIYLGDKNTALISWFQRLWQMAWEGYPHEIMECPFTLLAAFRQWLKHPRQSRISLELNASQLEELVLAMVHAERKCSDRAMPKKSRWFSRQFFRFSRLQKMATTYDMSATEVIHKGAELYD